MNDLKVIEAIKEQRDLVARSTLEKPQPDYAAYMKQVGIYNGLQTAISIIRDVAKKDIAL